MSSFLIKLAINYLKKHGYISRNLIADYVNNCKIYNCGVLAGELGEMRVDYSSLIHKELESYQKKMSIAEMNRHITDYETNNQTKNNR